MGIEGDYFPRVEASPENLLADYSDEAALERLQHIGLESVDFAFTVSNEEDQEGEPIPADITWTRVQKPENEEFADLSDVEGKLYLPTGENNNHELILFTPGFPGGNAGRFEQLYAKAFTEAGYSFFTVRHNGTSLTNGEASEGIINAGRRIELARSHGEHHIGGTKEEGHSPVEILREPLTPLLALYKNFDKVHLMGQSMGVAASYHAATRVFDHPEVTEKLGNIVGIAGYVGKGEGEPDEPWDGMSKPIDELVEYELGYIKQVDTNTMTNGDRLREELAKVAALNKEMKVPDHVGNVLVFTPEDPLISGPDKSQENYTESYGPPSNRKLIIRDETGLGEKRPHSMLWISPENLLRAVQAKVSEQGPHYVKIPPENKNYEQG